MNPSRMILMMMYLMCVEIRDNYTKYDLYSDFGLEAEGSDGDVRSSERYLVKVRIFTINELS